MVNCSFIVCGAETFHFHPSMQAAKANSTLESREIASCAKLQKQACSSLIVILAYRFNNKRLIESYFHSIMEE